MFAQLADLRLCAFMSLSPYVLRPYVPVPFCLRPYLGFRFLCDVRALVLKSLFTLLVLNVFINLIKFFNDIWAYKFQTMKCS